MINVKCLFMLPCSMITFIRVHCLAIMLGMYVCIYLYIYIFEMQIVQTCFLLTGTWRRKVLEDELIRHEYVRVFCEFILYNIYSLYYLLNSSTIFFLCMQMYYFKFIIHLVLQKIQVTRTLLLLQYHHIYYGS